MSKKNLLLIILLIFTSVGILSGCSKQKNASINKPDEQLQEQQISNEVLLEDTLAISKNYLILHYLTEKNLTDHNLYDSYEDWEEDFSEIIIAWGAINEQAEYLENLAKEYAKKEALADSKTKLVKWLIPSVKAITNAEINDIYDKAPFGKKIQTLAKFLGTDAKRAQLILNNAQNEIQREVWGEEGDAYKKMENTAIVVKDGCKVAGFVGGIVLTGGTAGFAASGIVAKTAVVVSGVDLVLEVGEDGANMALGDNNKVAQVVGNLRSVTEPTAGILTIVNIPGNLSTAVEKLGAITFGAEQVVSLAQDGKVIGINLVEAGENIAGTIKIPNSNASVGGQVVAGTEEEVKDWAKSVNIPMDKAESTSKALGIDDLDLKIAVNEIIDWLEEQEQKEKEKEKEVEDKKESAEKSADKTAESLAGSEWSGTLSNVSGGNNKKQTTAFDFKLNNDGSVSGATFKKWKQVENRIKLYGEDETSGYYEFMFTNNSLLLIKIVIGDEVIQPGEEYMGGIAPVGSLYRK